MSIQVEEIPDDIRETVVLLFANEPDGKGPRHSAIAAALLAERERATRVQIEKDAALVETMPLEAWATPSHFAQRDKMRADVASAIRSQLTGGLGGLSSEEYVRKMRDEDWTR